MRLPTERIRIICHPKPNEHRSGLQVQGPQQQCRRGRNPRQPQLPPKHGGESEQEGEGQGRLQHPTGLGGACDVQPVQRSDGGLEQEVLVALIILQAFVFQTSLKTWLL